jgi:hypothetical protein
MGSTRYRYDQTASTGINKIGENHMGVCRGQFSPNILYIHRVRPFFFITCTFPYICKFENGFEATKAGRTKDQGSFYSKLFPGFICENWQSYLLVTIPDGYPEIFSMLSGLIKIVCPLSNRIS